MYTLADHSRNAVQFPACSLDHVWRQRGNRTGHCARCHATFEGVSLFDRHQTVGEDGRTHCKDPATETVGGTMLRLIDGSWRGPRMPKHVWDAKLGVGNAPEGDDAQ